MGAATLQDIVALLVSFALTGWLLGVAVVPERLGWTTRLWLSLALSASATVVLAFPGMLAGQLAGPWFPVLTAALALIAAFRSRNALLAGVRGRAATVARARRRLRQPSLRHSALWLLTIAAGLALAMPTLILPQLGAADAHGLLRGTTPWYYYRLVTDMVTANALPATIGEWGSLRAYPVEYLGTTLHTAITAILGGGPDLPFVEGYRLAVAVSAVAAGYALWRRWLPSWWAWIGAILTFTLLRITTRLVGYRPETFGLVLVLWSAWLFDQALERRSLRWGALTGLVSAICFHAHAEVWLTTLPLFGGILASRLIGAALAASRARAVPGADRAAAGASSVAAPGEPVSPGAPSAVPSAPPRWSRLVATVLSVGIAFGGVAVIAGISGTGARLADIAGKPGGVDLRAKYGDPTWAFFVEIIGLDPETDLAPTSFWDPIMQDSASVVPWTNLWLLDPVELAVIVAALLLLGLTAVRGDPRVQRLVVTWALYAVGLFIGAFVLWYLYDTYVPARAGPRRLLALYTIALAGLFPAAAWVLVRGMTRFARRRARPSSASRRFAFGLGVRAVALAAGIGLTVWLTPSPNALLGKGLSIEGYDAMTWMHDNLPPGSVVMANSYTDGSIGAVSGLIGWLDGRAPYLEDAEWLDSAISRLRYARDFLFDPFTYPPPDGVDYVLVGREQDLAGYYTWEPDADGWDGLDSYERLELVKAFRENELMLYRVLPPPANG